MKQIIVFIALTILGIAIYTFVMGDQATSVKSGLGQAFSYQVEQQKQMNI